MPATKREGATHITLRLPQDLKQQLAKDARDSFKSVNAEIVGRLRASYSQPNQPHGAQA